MRDSVQKVLCCLTSAEQAEESIGTLDGNGTAEQVESDPGEGQTRATRDGYWLWPKVLFFSRILKH